MKDHDHAGELTIRVLNGGGAVFDCKLSPVFGEQDRMIGESHNDAFTEHSAYGTVGGLSSVLVDDPEDGLHRLADGLSRFPAGHLLGYGIQKRHVTSNVGRDDRIPDAGQGHLEPFALLAQFSFRFLLCGDVTKAPYTTDIAALEVLNGRRVLEDASIGQFQNAALGTAGRFGLPDTGEQPRRVRELSGANVYYSRVLT